MTLEPDDITQVIEAVDTILARRMEEVYGVLEDLREQVHGSITMLNGNDQALVSEILSLKGGLAAEWNQSSEEAWRRFVEVQARELGIIPAKITAKKIVVKKGDMDDGGE
jgi:hypothetical protein